MRWTWKRGGANKHLVISWSGRTLAYVLACGDAVKGYTVLGSGVKRDCANDFRQLVEDLKAFNLEGLEVKVMLRPGQYQLLEIKAPAVAPDELRAAVRFKIRDMLDFPIDEVTLDLMRAGDGQQEGPAQLFAVAARNVVIRDVLDLCHAMRWTVSVIDIHEMAQRNLQTALIARHGGVNQAHAALFWIDQLHTVLTISANGELFYTRRFDFLQGLSEAVPDSGMKAAAQVISPAAKSSVSMNFGRDHQESHFFPASRSRVNTPYISTPMPAGGAWNDNPSQRFLAELKRSFDFWERTWPGMPLASMNLNAGTSSRRLAEWLGPELEQEVQPMDIGWLFPDFEVPAPDEALCLPLLGVLLRTENRTL